MYHFYCAKLTLLFASLLLGIPLFGNTINLPSLEEIVCQSDGRAKVTTIGASKYIEYTLSPDVSEKFNAIANHIKYDPYVEWTLCLKQAENALRSVIPQDLIAIVLRMRHSNEPAVLIIHKMPVDTYIPKTPEHGNRPDCKKYDSNGHEIHNETAKGFVSEMVLCAMCSLLQSKPDFDVREKDGTYIHQIIPRDDDKSKEEASSAGSEIPFYPHTENVYSQPPLKFFQLLCLRGDPKVSTGVLFLDLILEQIKHSPPAGLSYEQLLMELQKPQFIMCSGPSFGTNTGDAVALPILTTNQQGKRIFRFNANPHRVKPTNVLSEKIINHLCSFLIDPKNQILCGIKITLMKGDYLLFNNWEIMHARETFTIDKNNWRWLQRMYLMIED
jgi:hypothetical protein